MWRKFRDGDEAQRFYDDCAKCGASVSLEWEPDPDDQRSEWGGWWRVSYTGIAQQTLDLFGRVEVVHHGDD